MRAGQGRSYAAAIPPGPIESEAVRAVNGFGLPGPHRRRQEDGSYRLSNGLEPSGPGPSALASHEFLAIADLDGEAAGARIWQAAPVSHEDLEKFSEDEMTWEDEVRFDPIRDRATATRKRMLASLCLEEAPGRRPAKPDPRPDERHPGHLTTALGCRKPQPAEPGPFPARS